MGVKKSFARLESGGSAFRGVSERILKSDEAIPNSEWWVGGREKDFTIFFLRSISLDLLRQRVAK